MMNIADLSNLISGKPLTPRCKDFYGRFGAFLAKDFSCPNCGHMEEFEDTYKVNGNVYPLDFNESRGSTMDGNYWDWDELHCCSECFTMYWFRNGAY